MTELWSGLARTLARLDDAAAEAASTRRRGGVTALRRLQYACTSRRELVYGLEPPATEASAHAELADALVCARDATADDRGGGVYLGRGRRRAAPARVARCALPRAARAHAPGSTFTDARARTAGGGRGDPCAARSPSRSRSAARSRSSPARRLRCGRYGSRASSPSACRSSPTVRNRAPHGRIVYSLQMLIPRLIPPGATVPRPTLQYRLKAWRAFQRALDPLAPPKPLRPPRP